VISYCVLNLAPDKPQVWREIARVLRPGGRVAISDLALLAPLPAAVQGMVEALVGCVAGAAPVEETRAQMQAAGLVGIEIVPKPEYVAAMEDVQDPLYAAVAEHLPAGARVSDYVASVDIRARRAAPRAKSCC
jgi:SAM-dependent methyltransferase